MPRVTQIDFHEVLRRNGKIRSSTNESREILYNYVATRYNIGIFNENVKKYILVFLSDHNKRWVRSQRNNKGFLAKNSDWLQTEMNIPRIIENEAILKETKHVGRPTTSFDESSSKSKKTKIQGLLESRTTEQLCFAARLSLTSSKKRLAAEVIKEATATSPARASKLLSSNRARKLKKQTKFTSDEALALIDLDLSKNQYIVLRNRLQSKNVDVFPTYLKVQKANEDCYPKEMKITETGAEINLQSLLDCTINRLVKAQEQVFEQCEELEEVQLLHKWGFDGSSGQQQYKQPFRSETTVNVTDADLFLTSIVPIQLFGLKRDNSKIILWQNPRVSSTKHCCPIRFAYEKETKATPRLNCAIFAVYLQKMQITWR